MPTEPCHFLLALFPFKWASTDSRSTLGDLLACLIIARLPSPYSRSATFIPCLPAFPNSPIHPSKTSSLFLERNSYILLEGAVLRGFLLSRFTKQTYLILSFKSNFVSPVDKVWQKSLGPCTKARCCEAGVPQRSENQPYTFRCPSNPSTY